MKYSVTVPPEIFEAAKEAARQAGISSAEWSRLAIVAALTPKGPDPDLERARSDLARTREERDNLASDAAEVERLRVDFATCNQALKEEMNKITALEVQTDQYRDQVRTFEERSRAAELRAALIERDLETAEVKRLGIEAVQVQLEERVKELKGVISQYEGQIASLMTIQNRVLTESRKPWWAFWRV